MRKLFIRIGIWSIFLLIGLLMSSVAVVRAEAPAQQPTVAIPTVTGTPSGPVVIVTSEYDQINVRSGPAISYAEIGILIAGETVPALGRTAAGDWIKVVYPGVKEGVGWVYSPLVRLGEGSELPIVEPPPKPTPLVTPTIDPTLAAQFVQDVQPTRVPTFTPPPPLVVPTYESETPALTPGDVPMGLVITLFGVIGFFGAVVSFLRGR